MTPTPSISHQVVSRPVTQELAMRGHDVTIITADPAFLKDDAPANLTEIDVHNISYTLCYMKKETKKDLLDQFKILLDLFGAQVKEVDARRLIKDED